VALVEEEVEDKGEIEEDVCRGCPASRRERDGIGSA
jgi:hypothetical protein